MGNYCSVEKKLESDILELDLTYQNLQEFFSSRWLPLRRRTIKKLGEIADAIQKKEDIYRKGSVLYSCGNIIAGGLKIGGIIAAPFTLGTSLKLTVAGYRTNLVFSAASLIHRVIKKKTVSTKCEEAIEICDSDTEMTKRLSEYVDDINKKCARISDSEANFTWTNCLMSILGVKGYSDLIPHLNALYILVTTGDKKKALGFLLKPDLITEKLHKFAEVLVAKDVAMVDILDIPFTCIGDILNEIKSICDNARMISENELCPKAREIHDVINRLQEQEDELMKRLFSKGRY